MSRRAAFLTCLVAACSDDGSGGGSPTFTEVNGLEGQDVHLLVPTPDGIAFLRGMPTAAPMRVVGEQAQAITMPTQGSVLRMTAGPDGTVYYTQNTTAVYRVDGSTSAVDATLPESVADMFVDGTGGMYVVQSGGLAYRAAGGTSFAPVDLGALTLIVPATSTRAADGSVYIYNAVAGQAGIVKMAGGTAAMAVTCNIPELSFCNSDATFAMDLDAEPTVLAGGEFYRLQGDVLTPLADPPADHTYVLGMSRSPNGELYIASAFDNLASSPAHLFVLRGSSWVDLGVMPGRGVIRFGGNGTLYAALTRIGGPGGLWVVSL